MKRKNLKRMHRYAKLLYAAQEGKCFHCDKPIKYLPGEEYPQEEKATRDHVFCRQHRIKYSSFGWFFILACYQCNWNRKDTPLTNEQIQKAANLWTQIGKIPTLDIPVFYFNQNKSINYMKKVKCSYQWWLCNQGKVWCKTCIAETIYAPRLKFWFHVDQGNCKYRKIKLEKFK